MSDTVEKIWEHIEDIGVCMLTTNSGTGLRARPMMALADRDENIIRFIADCRQHKDNEIQANPEVCLAFAAPKDNFYLSITGTARIDTRQAAVRDHWVKMADVWFDHGKDDPNAILIEVSLRVAEYWQGLGTAAQSIELIKAQLTGDKPDLGENETVAL